MDINDLAECLALNAQSLSLCVVIIGTIVIIYISYYTECAWKKQWMWDKK